MPWLHTERIALAATVGTPLAVFAPAKETTATPVNAEIVTAQNRRARLMRTAPSHPVCVQEPTAM